MTIGECAEKVSKAVSMESEAVEYVVRDKEFNDGLVKMEQDRLFEGARADGTVIEPEYTLFTKRVKSANGQPTDRVTLFDTGSFYNNMFVRKDGDSLIFSSSDSKTEELVEKYGEAIFGLTDYDKEEAKKDSAVLILRWLKEVTGL